MQAAPTPSSPGAAAEASDAIVARGLAMSIGGRSVLRELDLVVPRGRCVAVLGANGAGKTTLLRILAMLVQPDAGSLTLFGEPAGRDRPELRARVGLIGHQAMVYRDLSPAENLELFARLHALPRPRERAREMLEFVGLSERATDPVRALSRGMAQRVGIARALLHEPELLLADEPFTGLDVRSSARLADCLVGLRARGRTIVLTHHHVPEALGLCEHLVALRDGRKVLDAPSRGLDERTVLETLEPRP